MARLQSEDVECPSGLQINAGRCTELPGENAEIQLWQNVGLVLTSGKRTVSTLENEDSLICLSPADEIGMLVDNLKQLVDSKRDEVIFEPAEPSFELSFVRTRRGGIRVEAWLDAGNGTTGIYTWDACGIRFYTTIEYLTSFVGELETEFVRQSEPT